MVWMLHCLTEASFQEEQWRLEHVRFVPGDCVDEPEDGFGVVWASSAEWASPMPGFMLEW